MANNTPLISIIIVNYDTPKLTADCLSSLQTINHEGFRYNVLVVDNGSQPEFNIPKKYTVKKNTTAEQVELIRSDANIGFTGGNNLGMSYAVKHYNPDYFLLLNSDTTVEPNFLAELFAGIQGKNRGIAGSKIYFEKGCEYHHDVYQEDQLGNVIWFAGGTIDWANLLAFHRGVDEVDRGQFEHLKNTDFVTGCCMLIKREVIEKIGILDKKYFLYLEDVDFCQRAVQEGYKLVFCPQSVVYHKNAGSSGGSGSRIHTYYQTRNRLLFFLKYAPQRYRLTAIKYLLKLLTSQQKIHRRAALDYLLKRFGKQPLI